MRNSIKKLALGLVALSAFSLTACMSSGSSLGPDNTEGFGTVVIQAKAGDVNKLSKPGLGKASVIQLDTLIVTAISNATIPDTVTIKIVANDTTIIGTDSVYNFTDTSTIDQTISFKLNLKALRTWTITALTKDVNDSTIHNSDTVVVTNLKAGQVVIAALNATPEFSMYKATFNFPDSISSSTGPFKQKIDISLIEFIVDGDVVVDSSDAFESDSNYQISYDYVSVGADSVALKVYGTLESAAAPWNTESLLYSKVVAIADLNQLTGGTSTTTVDLDWVGPQTGDIEDLTIEIGRVGTYNINANLEPEIID